MRSAAECNQQAERCERSAESAWDEGIRATFQAIAAAWRDMAEFETRKSARVVSVPALDTSPPFFDAGLG